MKALLDHLVGAGEDRLRHGEAEGFCGFQIDDEFELGRLLHWQIGGLRALEDPPGVDPGLAANRWRRTVSFSSSCTCSAAICRFTVSICEL